MMTGAKMYTRYKNQWVYLGDRYTPRPGVNYREISEAEMMLELL